MTDNTDSSTGYDFSYKGIAWPGEAKKYVNPDKLKYQPEEIVPPPNWVERIGNTYNSSNIPYLRDDEHFQNWMRTAGLPEFTKLYGRNDNDKLAKGKYEITINLSASLNAWPARVRMLTRCVSLVRLPG